MTTITPVPPKYSHLTQQLLNYFPDTDTRIRENPVTLGAQLLNAVAFQMEQQNMRINRELRALNLASVPMNIDNGGVYYGARVPLSFNLPIDSQGNLLPPSTVQGQISGGPLVTLTAYDDTLPVPTRVVQEPTLSAVPLSNPQLFSTTGTGVPQTFVPGVLPLPNALTFYVQGMGSVTSVITISVTGELDPPAVWPQDIQSKNEVLTISDDGFYTTDSVWSSVASVAVTGLPTGCQLVCYSMGFNLPAVADLDRPFVHSAYRGVAFPRYWQLDNMLLLEMYQRNRFAGYELYQAYRTSGNLLDVAVEPNTWGIFVTDGTNLIYADRRTPMPSNLLETGNTVEPAWGLNVWYDVSQINGNTNYAYVSPQPLASAGTTTQYRYVVEDPNGNLFVLLPNGTLQTYTGTTGWAAGTPTAVSFPLTVIGTYLISLETLGAFNAKTVDVHPFGNFNIQTQATISLASVVPGIQGIAFDAYDRLWAWTGQFAVPLKISYDAYVWDPTTRSIYCTDQYTQIQIQ